MGELHTVWLLCQPSAARAAGTCVRYLWDPGVYFDSVAVFGFVLVVIFLFLEV